MWSFGSFRSLVLLLLHEEALQITSLYKCGENNDENLEQRPVEDALIGALGSIAQSGLTTL